MIAIFGAKKERVGIITIVSTDIAKQVALLIGCRCLMHHRKRGEGMTEIESLQAQCKELKCALDREIDEKTKLGIMYEDMLKERVEADKRNEFLLGQIEAYKYCIENIRR